MKGVYAILYFDDGTKLRMMKHAFYDAGVDEGDELEEYDFERLLAESKNQSVKEIAARMLSRGRKSEEQVRERLARKGFDEDDIEDAISFLIETGLLDDEDYAKTLVAAYQEKRKSIRAIREKLKLASIDEDIIDVALATSSEEKERKNIRALIEQKYDYYTGKDPEHGEARLAKLLARKGFEQGMIRKEFKQFKGDL